MDYPNGVRWIRNSYEEVPLRLKANLKVTVGASMRGNLWPIIILSTMVLSTILRAVALTYLAQIFYTDTGVVLVTTIQYHNQMDDDEIKTRREQELSDVAAALGLGQDDTQENDLKGDASEKINV